MITAFLDVDSSVRRHLEASGFWVLTATIVMVFLAIPGSTAAQQKARKPSRPLRKPDVIYYSTPPETVDEMLRMAAIKPGDVLYDLGSGDGRIPVAAAQRFGIRAVGVEIDPKLVSEGEENARKANVASLVRFRNEDMFVISLREATVVTLYLSEKLNVLLRPKLLRELRPGSRIISHDFRMGDWPPEETVRVPWLKGFRTVYKWTVPPAKTNANRGYLRRGPR
ncbi:MAG TPA: methyltransferase domain-containing protein [Pyrinomonadaceae bacterium]|nr:methyltransferase domain-containing protein [Pyrinomonadaceae bacterium]